MLTGTGRTEASSADQWTNQLPLQQTPASRPPPRRQQQQAMQHPGALQTDKVTLRRNRRYLYWDAPAAASTELVRLDYEGQGSSTKTGTPAVRSRYVMNDLGPSKHHLTSRYQLMSGLSSHALHLVPSTSSAQQSVLVQYRLALGARWPLFPLALSRNGRRFLRSLRCSAQRTC